MNTPKASCVGAMLLMLSLTVLAHAEAGQGQPGPSTIAAAAQAGFGQAIRAPYGLTERAVGRVTFVAAAQADGGDDTTVKPGSGDEDESDDGC